MARTARDGLSRHPVKGYRLTIGKKPNGKPRLFWLGHDRLVADFHARMLRDAFTIMKEEKRDVWMQEDVDGVNWWVGYFERSRQEAWEQHRLKTRSIMEAQNSLPDDERELRESWGDQPGTLATKHAPVLLEDEDDESNDDDAPTPTLYDAIAEFLVSFKGKRKSARHKQRMDQVLNVNLKRIRSDCPIDSINFQWIDRVCDHFKSRPPNQKDGKPLAATSVKGILTYLRLFFTWLDDVEFGGWEMPRKAPKCFKVRLADLMSPSEIRSAGMIKQFDVETLKILYNAASARLKSLMLTALFCGFTQHELAVLERSEVDLANARISHVRHKTKVIGEFWIPPELVTLLRAEFAARPNDTLCWRTEQGKPLVSYSEHSQSSDAVRQAWDDLRKKAGLTDALPFKYLRKFLADYCTAHGGEELGQIAMSHSRQTVLARNYTTARPFDRFHALQQQFYGHLAEHGLFKSTAGEPNQSDAHFPVAPPPALAHTARTLKGSATMGSKSGVNMRGD